MNLEPTLTDYRTSVETPTMLLVLDILEQDVSWPIAADLSSSSWIRQYSAGRGEKHGYWLDWHGRAFDVLNDGRAWSDGEFHVAYLILDLVVSGPQKRFSVADFPALDSAVLSLVVAWIARRREGSPSDSRLSRGRHHGRHGRVRPRGRLG